MYLSRPFQRLYAVNLRLLLEALDENGVRGITLKLIDTYINERTQSVRIGDSVRSQKRVSWGVSPGTVFGTLLFVLY